MTEGPLAWMALVPLTPPCLFQVMQGEQSWSSLIPGTQNSMRDLSGAGHGEPWIFPGAEVPHPPHSSSVFLQDFRVGPRERRSSYVFPRQSDCFSTVFHRISNAPRCLILIRKLLVKHVQNKYLCCYYKMYLF